MRAEHVQFGEWTPDLPESNNPGALIAKNVLPQLDSYTELRSLTSFTNALTGACLGAVWAQDGTNAIYNFAGDATKLYRLVSDTTWTDVSGTSAPFSADNWEFTKFGDRIIAANKNDAVQYFDMGSSSVFADLPGSPPAAQRVATVRDFVFLGDIPSKGPNFIQWCGFNNSEIWTPSLAYQSDSQELFGKGGRVQRIVPGEYAVIFMEHSIFRADYTGPPAIFQIDEVERRRGTPAPNSVVWSGGTVFYYGWDGFYMFDGERSEPISANRVSNWFTNEVASDSVDSLRGVLDRKNRLLIWGFKSSSSATQNDRLIIYNWVADKWSYAEIDTQLLAEYVATGYDLDGLDTPLPSGIDIDSIPVDSDQFSGGALNIMAFDSDNKSATFSGSALTACIDTREISHGSQERLFVNSLRPLVEGDSNTAITVQVGSRNKLDSNSAFSIAKSLNGINGECSLRVNARYQRYRLNISGGFQHANGVKIQHAETGARR